MAEVPSLDEHTFNTEALLGNRPVILASLKTDVMGFKDYYGTPDETKFDANVQLLLRQTEELLEKSDADLIIAPEYALYYKSSNIFPVEFEQQEDGTFKPTNDSEGVGQVLKTLSELARRYKSTIIPGTVCEKMVIDGVTVLHNTAVVIDHNGNIVQLRRKVTGSDAMRIDGEQLNSEWKRLLYGQNSEAIENGTFIPSGENETLFMNIYKSASETIKPIEMTAKSGSKVKLAVVVCAERTGKSVYPKLNGEQVDVVALIVRERDDHYERQSKIELNQTPDNYIPYDDIETKLEERSRFYKDRPDRDQLIKQSKEWYITQNRTRGWQFRVIMEEFLQANGISPKGVWLASDSDSPGVFSANPDNKPVESADFDSSGLVAHCVV